jgi:hypothetical protein
VTFLPQEGPPPELSTTRVGGGFSARLVTVAVAGVLIAVVGFTVINRPPAPPAPSPTTPAVAAVPTAMPTPTPPRNQLQGNDGILGWPVIAQLGVFGRPPTITTKFAYRYAVAMPITGGIVRIALDQNASDSYHGVIYLRPNDVGDAVQLDLIREWQQNGLTISESIRSWQLSIQRLRKLRRGMDDLLVEHVPPNSGGPAAAGYTFTVNGLRRPRELLLLVDLVWPQATQVPLYVGPRNPALYNRCRWDIGPLAAPPRQGTNEADC